MEFACRGRPATASADADAGDPFRDPPSHAGYSALVIREALQAQLQKDRLRQEIIEAELAKIDRAMALRPAATRHCVSPGDVQQGTAPASSYSVTDGFSMPHGGVSGAAHDPKKKDGSHGGLESKPWNPFTEHRSSSADGNAGQEGKLQESNETKQTRPRSPTWEMTEVTLPVKRPKAPERWSCTVCQVEATSEHNLQQHFAGQKHQTNVASLGSGDNNHLHLRPPSAGGKPPLNGSSSNIVVSLEKARPMMPLYFCKVCGVQCSDKATFQDHRRQKKHKAKAWRQKRMTFCKVCKLQCYSKEMFADHLAGKKHQKNAILMDRG